MPAAIEVGLPTPLKIEPNVTPATFPPITAAVSTISAGQCSAMSAGSIIIPTENEENRTEYVAQRRDQMLDLLGLAGFRDQ